jgi:hypothetical protein
MFLNSLNQLLDVDGLGEKGMSVDVETSVRLGPRDERSEENDWRVLQFRIGSDLCRDFATVSVGHDYVKEDQIGAKISSALISVGRFVLFED